MKKILVCTILFSALMSGIAFGARSAAEDAEYWYPCFEKSAYRNGFAFEFSFSVSNVEEFSGGNRNVPFVSTPSSSPVSFTRNSAV